MTFLWSDMLWLLLAVPALIAAYLLLLRRKKKAALRYASLNMVKEAMGASQKFRRHLPPLLLLLALILMITAMARPAAVIILPSQHETVILAMDIRQSLHYLGEITGESTTDERLGNIFRNFCIGK